MCDQQAKNIYKLKLNKILKLKSECYFISLTMNKSVHSLHILWALSQTKYSFNTRNKIESKKPFLVCQRLEK